MLRYLKKNEIDISKYDACINASINTRIYAFSWYLDCVADNWDALVLNDYEAVMPLPWRSKYFIKYIYPPAWTQQLGVFSKEVISADLVKQFVKAIPKKFKKITIQFNSENDLSLLDTKKRVNYVLPLDKPYEEIYKGFNKNRKRIIKSLEKKDFEIDKKMDKNIFLKFYLESEKKYELNPIHLKALKELLNLDNTAINLWGILSDGSLISGLFWLKDNKRITFLLPFSNQTGNDLGTPTLIVNELISQFSVNELILDFEGSMIEGVADFYRSFGAKKEYYAAFSFKYLLNETTLLI